MKISGRLAQISSLPGNPGDLRLSDRVVELRPLAVGDAEEHAAGQDHIWRRWLGSGAASARAVAGRLAQCEERWRRGGPVFAFGVRTLGSPSLLGTVELLVDEPALQPGQVSISCGLYPRARGQGLAKRACRLAAGFALRALAAPPWNVTEVVAQIDPLNVSSLQMIERAGFAHTGSEVAAGEAWEVFAMDLPRLDASPLYTRPRWGSA